MIKKTIFEIDGKPIRIETVWVHLQSETSDCKSYRWLTNEKSVNDVFDPHLSCSPSNSIDQHVKDQIDEFGTFIVDGYLKNSLKIENKARAPFDWVLATVDCVDYANDMLCLEGKIMPFRR